MEAAGKENFPGPIWPHPETFPAVTVGLDIGNLSLLDRQGYMYWVAYYDGIILTQANLEDLYSGVTHPVDDFLDEYGMLSGGEN